MTWQHDQLSRDLHDRMMKRTGTSAWWEVQVPDGTGRIDVVTVHWDDRKRVGHWTVYEVKARLSDYTEDAVEGKWRKYAGCSDFLFFASPAGLIDPLLLADGAGLMERHGDQYGGSWRVKKKAPRMERQVTDVEWFQKLAIREMYRRPIPDEQQRLERMRRYVEMLDLSTILRGRVAREIADIRQREYGLRSREERVEEGEKRLAASSAAAGEWEITVDALHHLLMWVSSTAAGKELSGYQTDRIRDALARIGRTLDG